MTGAAAAGGGLPRAPGGGGGVQQVPEDRGGVALVRPQSRAAPEPTIASLSVAAVPPVNLRVVARQEQTAAHAASEVVDPLWVRVLSTWRSHEERELTPLQFTLALARLGGHRNRECATDSQIG
jgi:hypothetical protein